MKSLIKLFAAVFLSALAMTSFASSACQQCNTCRYQTNGDTMMSGQCENTCSQCHVSDIIMHRESKSTEVTKTTKAPVNAHYTQAGCSACHMCMYSRNNNMSGCEKQCSNCQLSVPFVRHDSAPSKPHNFANQSDAFNQHFDTHQAQARPKATAAVTPATTQAAQTPATANTQTG